ncbi:hypothetical protein WA026_007273 [Henosepilachna vigintioctopunctata]|uniref:Uncharacterized protein n=1 Tax=Henosepilachna vigintioctopunctata TaxID=420089 RepID=A0AAW1ULE9_9CUCU
MFLLFIFLFPGAFSVHAPLSKSGQDVFFRRVLVGEDTNRHPCSRKCVAGEAPMICEYDFTLELYDVLSKACFDCPNKVEDCFLLDCVPADGVKRSILTVNRKLPGPLISVCHGDKVIVNVENHLLTDSTTIHWHGQKVKDAPYMDGVPYISQCPILPESSFRYKFIAEDAGTHLWHSHIGLQRGDGIFGGIVVRSPKNLDPHGSLYDFDLDEHVMVILDWDHVSETTKFTSHYHNVGDGKPITILVNGLGRYYGGKEQFGNLNMPTARFTVKKGYRYRFRVINTGFLNCPIDISIDNHTLNVISSDGYDFKSTEADSLVTYAGERFDFILDANQPEDVYWMRFGGIMDCDERFASAFQVAKGKQINPLNHGTESSSKAFVTAPELESLHPWDESLKEIPDYTYYIAYDFYKANNPSFYKSPNYDFNNIKNKDMLTLTPQLNYISMKLLPFPIFSQRNEINEDLFCNETTLKDTDCKNNFCSCPHVIQVDLNAVVELFLIDKGFAYDANHPFHLHGHAFRVVAMERVGSDVELEKVIEMNEKGQIKRNLKNAPWKDTVTVPDGGFTVLRFHATNPGYWLFHCHLEFHAEVGMSLVFKVGQHADMVSVPDNFPKCGNYI